MLVEVNPLLVTGSRDSLVALGKVTVDKERPLPPRGHRGLPQPERRGRAGADGQGRGLTYVKLDGNVGILGNGAGLVMSTLDVVAQAGGKPANFLDAGGGSKADAIVNAVEVILSDPKVSAVLFNIFGGITRCDEVARGLVTAFEQIDVKVPFVVRLDGTNDEEGPQDPGRRRPAQRPRPAAPGGRGRWWSWRSEHSRHGEHQARRLRPDRPGGQLPRRTIGATARGRGGGYAGQGRRARTWRASRSSTRSTTRWRRPRPTRA